MSYILDNSTPSSKLIFLDTRDVVKSGGMFFAQTPGNDPRPIKTFFKYLLKEPLEILGAHDILLSLHSCSIPFTFYNVRDGINNKLDVRVRKTDGTTIEYTIVIEPGNYESTGGYLTLRQHFNAQQSAGVHPTGLSLVMGYDVVSLKFEWHWTGAAYTHLEFLSQSGGNHQGGFGIDQELGLSTTQDFVIPRTDAGATIVPQVAPQVSDVDGSVQGLFIRTGLMQQGVLDSASDTFGNILARVPIKVQPGAQIFHDPINSTHKCVVQQRSVDELMIRITDERNRVIDLNGPDLNIALQLDFIPRRKKLLDAVGRPAINAVKIDKKKKKKPRVKA